MLPAVGVGIRTGMVSLCLPVSLAACLAPARAVCWSLSDVRARVCAGALLVHSHRLCGGGTDLAPPARREFHGAFLAKRRAACCRKVCAAQHARHGPRQGSAHAARPHIHCHGARSRPHQVCQCTCPHSWWWWRRRWCCLCHCARARAQGTAQWRSNPKHTGAATATLRKRK